jgi:hypothetical protein
MPCWVRDWGEKIKESYIFCLMVHKQHHARHKLVLYEYIYVYRKKLQANFILLLTGDPIKCLSATEPYSLHIRSVFVTDRLWFCIRIRTLSAPIPNSKKIWQRIRFHYYPSVSAPFSPCRSHWFLFLLIPRYRLERRPQVESMCYLHHSWGYFLLISLYMLTFSLTALLIRILHITKIT